MKPENATAHTSSRFPPAARVRAKADYARVFERARRTSDPLLVLHRVAGDSPARLGLAVSRKVSPHAVVRNRIKRALREQFRLLRTQLQPGDCVVVARSGAATATSAQLRAAFVNAMQRAGALRAPQSGPATMPPPLNSPAVPSTSLSIDEPEPDAGRETPAR